MADAHVCPRCDGERTIYSGRSGQQEPCPTCHGEGVVWDRGVRESSEERAADDVLDLTGS